MDPQVQNGFLFEDASGRKVVPPVSAGPRLWHCPDPFLSNREMPVCRLGRAHMQMPGSERRGARRACRHACGLRPQSSGGFAAGTCAPVSPARKPRAAAAQARSCFSGFGNGPAPKDRRICLAPPAQKAVLCPLHNAPESARKDHYCGETPPGIQRISACFNADRCKKLPSGEKAYIFSPNTKPMPSVICRKHRLLKTISVYVRADGYPFPPFRFSAHQGRLAQTKFRFQ